MANLEKIKSSQTPPVNFYEDVQNILRMASMEALARNFEMGSQEWKEYVAFRFVMALLPKD